MSLNLFIITGKSNINKVIYPYYFKYYTIGLFKIIVFLLKYKITLVVDQESAATALCPAGQCVK